jgi:putative phosphoesterase
MRIAVLADTHDKLPAHLLPLLADAQEIWHLGDVTDEACLRPLQALKRRLVVVRGNCDTNPGWPWVVNLEREGFMIQLVHVPPSEAPVGVDILLHGHTHVPRNERVGHARFMNPGTVGKPNKGGVPSFAWLELVKGRLPRWQVVPL